MSVQVNVQLARALVAGRANSPVAPDIVLEDHAQGTALRGPAAAQAFFHSFSADGLRSARIEERCLVADETAAAMEFVLHARHTGVFAGMPPTGRAITLPVALICQIADGQVYRASLFYDAGTLLRQLGMAL